MNIGTFFCPRRGRWSSPAGRPLAVCLAALAALSVLAGCHNPSGVSTSTLSEGPTANKRIAVLPFQRVNPDEEALGRVSLTSMQTQVAAEGAPQRVIQDLFWDRIAASGKRDLVSPDRTGGILEQIRGLSYKTSLAEAVRKIGQELNADAVVLGSVRRFRERKGTDYAADKPASVAFDIALYRCADGVLVWRGVFDKTQTSLMENVLRVSYFFKDRGRWLTAKELAAQGMEDILGKFPAAP